MLPAAVRLRRRDEFAATIKRGRRAARGALVVHVRAPVTEDSRSPALVEGQFPPARAGFVVSKAVGGAVVRNKVKRRLRHLIAERLAELPAGADIVVRALPAASTRTFKDLEVDLAAALQAANRIKPRRSSP